MATHDPPTPERGAPASATRARRHLGAWQITGIVLAVLVLAVILCEAAGWPFLVKPAERTLSKLLQREVLLHDASEGRGSGARVRFFGAVKARAPVLQIAAPPWSKQPYFVRAEDASMHLAYSALWRARRGEPLDIERIEAAKLDVNAERLQDGRASWQFAKPEDPDKPDRGTPEVGELVLREGRLWYRDERLQAEVEARVRLNEQAGSQPGDSRNTGLNATAEGHYRGLPVTARLQAAGAMPLLTTGQTATPTPVTLHVEAADAQVDFKGTVTDVLHLRDLTGAVQVQGKSLATAGQPFGVALPSTGPFQIKGLVSKAGAVYRFVAEDARVGDSRLNAAVTYDPRKGRALLSGRVGGSRLVLADLAPSVGVKATAAPPGQVQATRQAQEARVAAAKKAEKAARQKAEDPSTPEQIAAATGGRTVGGTAASKDAAASTQVVGADGKPRPAARAASGPVLPQRNFDLPALRGMDANVLLAFDRLDLGEAFQQPLEPLRAHLVLNQGKLTIQDIDARTADGSVSGLVALDGTRDVAQWRADLRLTGVRVERWIKQTRGGDAPPYVAGRLSARAELTGQGRSTADILGSLQRDIRASMRDAQLSHLLVEGAGIDIAEAIGVVMRGDEPLKVQCAVADLQATQGVIKPRAFLIDTADTMVNIEGSVSLAREQLDLRAEAHPKDFSPLTLRTPITVKGTFAAPQVGLEKGPMMRKLAASLLLALVHPVAAVIPLMDPGDGEGKQGGCAALLDRVRSASPAPGAKKP